jgi:threonine dehydratase
MSSMDIPVTRESIAAAYGRIAPHVRRTPVLALPDGAFGLANPISLKLELLQHAGSFKARGAFNTLTAMRAPPAGVAAASGGNHGAAVAYAAGRLGVKARIFVPEISSPAKVAKIRAFGAEVVQQGARYADALALCEAYQAESGAAGIHAYDAWPTIEGQGTTALEWEGQAETLDTVLIATGGGGLVSGMAIWFAGRTKVVAVEPSGSRALHAALEAGRSVDVAVDSIAADSLGARSVGDRVHAVASRHVDHVALAPDDAIRRAMQALWSDFRIATEPGGAAALAALLSGAYRPAPGERVGVLVCGGNVDLAQLRDIVG